jgi:Fur family transcriptional regulator, stress-responsive regulator
MIDRRKSLTHSRLASRLPAVEHDNADELTGRLRGAGLRVTAGRLAVLEALAGEHRHLDADAVASAVRPRLGSLSTQAVYDILRTLTEAGLLRRIELSGQTAHYETRVGDNHHHVICRRCGATSDVDCVVGAAPCLEPAETHGFLLEEAEVTFWGLCPTCQAERQGEPTSGAKPKSSPGADAPSVSPRLLGRPASGSGHAARGTHRATLPWVKRNQPSASARIPERGDEPTCLIATT